MECVATNGPFNGVVSQTDDTPNYPNAPFSCPRRYQVGLLTDARTDFLRTLAMPTSFCLPDVSSICHIWARMPRMECYLKQMDSQPPYPNAYRFGVRFVFIRCSAPFSVSVWKHGENSLQKIRTQPSAGGDWHRSHHKKQEEEKVNQTESNDC